MARKTSTERTLLLADGERVTITIPGDLLPEDLVEFMAYHHLQNVQVGGELEAPVVNAVIRRVLVHGR
jgi:hypothetical protein